MNKGTTILLITICIISNSFSQQSKGLTKEKTIELYKKMYLSSEISYIPWNGDIDECESGTLDTSIYRKVENRVNFFRIVNGLSLVKIDTQFNKEAQDAALLIKANDKISHNPSSTMKCYSESASIGCMKSCLEFNDFKNFPATAFITGFIEEYGERNYFVGHRRWILYTRLKTFGYGATNNSEALLTADGVSKDTIPNQPGYIAYPWNGYVPFNLIFPKWSFSIPENKQVDFTNTTITMTDSSGNNIQLERLMDYDKYLDHTITWSVTGIFNNDDTSSGQNVLEGIGYLNKKIKVHISNVKVGGKIKNYDYVVVPIKI
jgi:hypothetical protein